MFAILHRSVKELLELKCFPTLLAGGVRGIHDIRGSCYTPPKPEKCFPQGLTGLPTGPPLVDPVVYPALPISSMTRSAPQHRWSKCHQIDQLLAPLHQFWLRNLVAKQHLRVCPAKAHAELMLLSIPEVVSIICLCRCQLGRRIALVTVKRIPIPTSANCALMFWLSFEAVLAMSISTWRWISTETTLLLASASGLQLQARKREWER